MSNVWVVMQQAGPSGGLPDMVPEFVSDILGMIGQFITGILNSIPFVGEGATSVQAVAGYTNTEVVTGGIFILLVVLVGIALFLSHRGKIADLSMVLGE